MEQWQQKPEQVQRGGQQGHHRLMQRALLQRLLLQRALLQELHWMLHLLAVAAAVGSRTPPKLTASVLPSLVPAAVALLLPPAAHSAAAGWRRAVPRMQAARRSGQQRTPLGEQALGRAA